MGATRYGQTALGRGFAAHPWRDAPTGGSQAVFSAALFFLRKKGTSVAVASSSARARLIADEDAPSHLCRKQAGSALGQLALQRLRLAPEHARFNAGWPFRPDFRHSISPPAARRHLLARAQQLVAHLVGVRVVRVRVRARSGLGVGFSSGFGLGPRLGLGSGLAHVSVVHVLEVQREEATTRADPREGQPLGTHVVGEHPMVPG